MSRAISQGNQRSPWEKKADYVCLPGDIDSAWTEVTAAAQFPGRSDMGCVSLDGKVIVAGTTDTEAHAPKQFERGGAHASSSEQ